MYVYAYVWSRRGSHVAVGGDHQVLRLAVAVGDAPGVEVVEGLDDAPAILGSWLR